MTASSEDLVAVVTRALKAKFASHPEKATQIVCERYESVARVAVDAILGRAGQVGGQRVHPSHFSGCGCEDASQPCHYGRNPEAHDYVNFVVDDERFMPDRMPGVTYFRSSRRALEALQSRPRIKNLWLDHDLGGDDDIRKVVLLLAEWAYNDTPLDIGTIYVHSMNAVGAKWMADSLAKYYKVVWLPFFKVDAWLTEQADATIASESTSPRSSDG